MYEKNVCLGRKGQVGGIELATCVRRNAPGSSSRRVDDYSRQHHYFDTLHGPAATSPHRHLDHRRPVRARVRVRLAGDLLLHLPGARSGDAVNVALYERTGMWAATAIIVVFLGMAGIGAVAFGIRPPSHMETVDPAQVPSDPRFATPGVTTGADGRVQATMVAGMFIWLP